MPLYRCENCQRLYRAKVDSNLTCQKWACGNAKLELADNPGDDERVNQYAASKKRREREQKVRDQRVSGFRPGNRNVNYNEDPNPEDYDDSEELDEIRKIFKFVEERELKLEAEDTDYVPTADRWNFDQRLTTGDMVERTVFPMNIGTIKPIEQVIGGPVEGERQKDCALIIGACLAVRRVSAWAVTNQVGIPMGTRWYAGNKDTAEWCHLVGVSLGGLTVASNLIAASYAANTYMGVIEKAIQGRTDLKVSVSVIGLTALVGGSINYAHIAEKIRYAIIRNRDNRLLTEFVIDARITMFSVNDQRRVEEQIRQNVPK